MTTNRINITMLMAGFTVGWAASWLCLRRRYERIAQEEINSVKAAFSKKNKLVGCEKEQTADTGENRDCEYVSKIITENNYADPGIEKEKDNMIEKPYIISPEEFGDIDDYDKISLTYYSDGVLTDEDHEIIDDIDETVGADFAEHFGEYESDSVFVRNDRLKCDYEILKDIRRWED